MLESLKVGNETITFSPGLNVILGKSLFMKLVYSCDPVSHALGKGDRKTKDELQRAIADKLKDVCMPDSLGRLVTRKPRWARCEVAVRFKSSAPADDLRFPFSTNSDKEVKMKSATPSRWLESAPVFLPTKKLLSVFPNFASTLRERHFFFDGIYSDFADTLGVAVLWKLRKEEQEMREGLEEVMRGKVVYDNNRFYTLFGRTGSQPQSNIVAGIGGSPGGLDRKGRANRIGDALPVSAAGTRHRQEQKKRRVICAVHRPCIGG